MKEKKYQLEEIKNLEINNGGKINLIIEGDNLASLTILENKYSEKIDLIIIDPPYNGHNHYLKYKDDFSNSKDNFGHKKWLDFMAERLKIAYKLLSNEGYIFINIDESELFHLKLLCDDIFGEHNYVGMYMWEKTSTPPALSNKIRRKLEYILCYAKNIDKEHSFYQDEIDGIDAPLINTGNRVKNLVFPKGTVQFTIKDGTYNSINGTKVQLLTPVTVNNGYNENELKLRGEFKWVQETLDEEIINGTTFLIRSRKFLIRYKRNSDNKIKIPVNLLNKELGIGTNENATRELNELGIKNFSYSKPVSLYTFLINMINQNKDLTILDFFAGSGTTGHATLQVNLQKNANHRFILCTDNQNDICKEITYRRIKKVIDSENLCVSLKYYKVKEN